MKVSSIVLAALMAFGSGGAFAAGGPLDLSSGSAGFSSTPVIGGFVDMFTFTLGVSSVASSSITSVVSGLQDIDFSSITLTGPSGVFSFTQILGDPFETWALANTTLASGSYSLTLIGMNSAAGASYGGNIAVTAIPEPETLALLLAGLGGMGFIARRRRLQ